MERDPRQYKNLAYTACLSAVSGDANSISYGRIVYSLFNYWTRNREFRNLNNYCRGSPNKTGRRERREGCA